MKPHLRYLWASLKKPNVRKKPLFIGLGGFFALVIVLQFLYPGDRLLPFTKIDGIDMAYWHKNDAAWELDRRYAEKTVAMYFGENEQPHQTPKLTETGITVTNEARLAQISYSWWAKLIPSSWLWYGTVQSKAEPNVAVNSDKLNDYTIEAFGEDCYVEPKNASLKHTNGKLEVISARVGGECDFASVRNVIGSIRPNLTSETKAKLPIKAIEPTITSESAKFVATRINERIGEGIETKVNDDTIVIPGDKLLTWLTFDNSGESLNFTLNEKKSQDYLNETFGGKLKKDAGVTYISTRDFTEISRKNGASGRALDVPATLDSLIKYIKNANDQAEAKSKSVPARKEFKRSYSSSSTGLSALMAHFNEENPGTFGVSLRELGGKNRVAHYNGNGVYTTASTYKLFVAYGALKRIDDKTWTWGYQVGGGRDLRQCFDDMIVKSDNYCAEQILKGIGYEKLTKEIRALGLSGSSGFLGDSPQTTANDLTFFMTRLARAQLGLKKSSNDLFVNTLKHNQYRSGIPAGTSGTVADKVGFLNGLLHDAAIVYDSNGTYALTIMSNGSSWGKIAELTKKIEALR